MIRIMAFVVYFETVYNPKKQHLKKPYEILANKR